MKFKNEDIMFDRALEEFPNDLHVKLKFAQYLLSQDKQLSRAASLLQDILRVQPNHHFGNLYKADIGFRLGRKQEIELQKNCDYLDRREPYLIALEFDLIRDGYLSSCCDVDQEVVKSASEISLKDINVNLLKDELLRTNISEERKREIATKVKEAIREFEILMFKALSVNQKKNYLSVTSSFTYGLQFWLIEYTLNDDLEKKGELERLINDSFIQQRLCILDSIERPENACVANLAAKLKENLKELLNEDQYSKISEYEERVPWLLTNVL